MRVLLIKTSALGDVVHAYGIASYLKEVQGVTHLSWLVEGAGADLLEDHPHVDEVIQVQTKRWRKNIFAKKTREDFAILRRKLRGSDKYDLVIDLQGNIKSGLLVSLCDAPVKLGFGKESVPERPNMWFTNTHIDVSKDIPVREGYLKLVQSYFGDYKLYQPSIWTPDRSGVFCLDEQFEVPGKKTVLIAPGSNWPNKQLPVDLLARFVSSRFAGEDWNILLSAGSDSERRLTEELRGLIPASRLLKRVPLRAYVHMLKVVDHVIAMDSLPLHLAASLGTPTTSFFGPSMASVYAPQGVEHESFQGDCCYGYQFKKRCPALRTCLTGACMQEIEEQLLEIETQHQMSLAAD